MSRPYPTGVTLHQYERALRSLRAEEKFSGLIASRRNNGIQEEKKIPAIDAAALQSDIARRLNLPGGRSVSSVIRPNREGRKKRIERICACCNRINVSGASVCDFCGFFVESVPQQNDTLAQVRGLIPKVAPVETLSQSEWHEIESKLDERGDAFCPICMEAFNQGHEVLLSCSHMFHRLFESFEILYNLFNIIFIYITRACLQSFEKFMKSEERTCPICRYILTYKQIN